MGEGHRTLIAGVGHCCQDNICTVEAYPPEDGSTHILSIDDTQGGGAVATALVAAARLGACCAMVADLGDDGTGDRIKSGFEAEHVDVSLIGRVKGGRSSTSYVMVDPVKGTRTKFPYRDSLPPLDFDGPRRALIAKADILHLDGTGYVNAVNAARLAKDAGTAVSLDGCSRRPDNADNLVLAALSDILIMNAVYPMAVSGKDSIADALRFMAALGRKSAVMMTAGADGCYIWQDERVLHLPAFPVRAVDTTGAGDVFHGAFLVRFNETHHVPESARFASAASALKCLKPGGRSGIPDRKTLDAFLLSHQF